ncbi:IS30 family transposase [Teredinibacter haidensis]|uniref:IS30 family transposase n=1 Tax=Teredinibacter haidensis TaxID=2731755 RepID=UPI0009490242|nr:IS30 family transposase [Teredinibacter haidensis]
MTYHQLTTDERYTIAAYLKQRKSQAFIARALNRSPSSISRELKRNRRPDGKYCAARAVKRTSRIRRESRRKWYFTDIELQMVIALIRLDWSPEQASLWLKKCNIRSISHSTIYRYIWYDIFYLGDLHKHLRQSQKQRRKKYRSPDSRGVLANKAHISERPIGAENKSRIGHFEIDTVHGSRDQHSIVTLVDRKSKYTIIGKIKNRTTDELNRKVIQLIAKEVKQVRSITSDNGTEFHQYKKIEEATNATFYFANPYHSWERGLNENTNGLIRQYLPKGESMKNITQKDCDKIAMKLNRRTRKCLNMETPEAVYVR